MEECPALRIMKLLGEKWVIVIIRELSEKGKRFNELNRNIKMSSRTLSKRLKELEKVKIIKKQFFKEIPPRVEYSLTDAGKDLMKSFKNLDEWIKKWNIKI
jgi:DNA-binding HxlR family transcriptional regulator